MERPSVSLVLDGRKKSKLDNDKYPIVIRIGRSKNDSQKRVTGKHYFTKKEYAELYYQKNLNKSPYKDIHDEFRVIIQRAEAIVDELMPDFTYVEFFERFYDLPGKKVLTDKSSFVFISKKLEKHYKENQYSMSVKIKDMVSTILKYEWYLKKLAGEVDDIFLIDRKRLTRTERVEINELENRQKENQNLPMRAITPAYCRKFEQYMYDKSKKGSRNGAGIILRHVRILYNFAITEGYVPRKWYPFKRKSGERSDFRDPYVIPSERKDKDYLTEDELYEFLQVNQFNTEAQRKAHFAWLLSFYCNGANAADILSFKYRDISGDFIMFYREKIRNTTRTDRKLVKVYLSPELRYLIKEFGNPTHPNNYIFPVFTNEMNEEERYDARKTFVSNVTKSLKHLAANLGMLKNVRYGNARHSLANLMKKNKVDRETAKDILGHTTIAQLDNYLGSFDEEDHIDFAKTIMSFGSIKKRVEHKRAKAVAGTEPAMDINDLLSQLISEHKKHLSEREKNELLTFLRPTVVDTIRKQMLTFEVSELVVAPDVTQKDIHWVKDD